MKTIYSLITLIIILFCPVASLSGKVKLPVWFSDGMVLQQESVHTVWGETMPGKKVSIRVSWDKRTQVVTSDDTGYFEFTLATPSWGGPYEIEVSDGEPVLLTDIYLGDVWICSGQSNMEMPVKGYRGQPVYGSQQAIVGANERRPLRLFTISRAYSITPQKEAQGCWETSNSKAVADFSAAGYFFGDLLEKKLQIPIGLVHVSWSASKIEAWMDKHTLSQFPEIDLSVLQNEEFGYPNGTPTLLYNAMVYPLKGIAVKGVIWYQGEANSAQPELYERLFPAWIQQWRDFFQHPQMPVYYTQLAPYQGADKNALTLPLFREMQLKSMLELPYVGMAFMTDIGDEKFIHAPEKQKVGERLAYWALAKTYGIEGIPYCGPIYTKHVCKGAVTELYFDYGEDGLTPENCRITGFEIAGVDGLFYEAEAEIINGSNRVKVWHEDIAEPVEIRYCFRNYKEGNLANNAGLPAAAFRIQVRDCESYNQ